MAPKAPLFDHYYLLKLRWKVCISRLIIAINYSGVFLLGFSMRTKVRSRIKK